MNLHDLIKKRIRQKRENLLRSKRLGKFLMAHLQYELDETAYDKGFNKLMKTRKDKLITRFLTKEDVIFFNEFG